MIKKYRAYDVQKKFYGKVDLIMWLSDDHIEVDYEGHAKEPRRVRPEEVIVEEYSGVKLGEDELYEGDILEYDGCYAVISQENGIFGYRWVGKDFHMPLFRNLEDKTLVGNVNLNPELLKQEK